MPTILKLRNLAIGMAGSCTLAFADDSPPPPHLPIPNPAQLAWHKDELRMFAHFGMKTFYPSSNHMGNGREDPARFNPARFDPDQWVAAAKAGGFQGIVLTTKHHDGFCNWQTDTTSHSVKSATWRNGKGDIVRDLANACRKGGIKFGVYVSIIDHHFNVAGGGEFPNYGAFYLAQIKELSTRYGAIDEYWFDGFNADKLKMDYRAIADVIREHQPKAVVYDSKTLVKYLPDRCLAWPNAHGGVTPDQDYRQTVDGRSCWYPNEASLILQGNWFHIGQPAIPLSGFQEYYLRSVGFGTTPLMNVAPNQDGLIDEATVERMKEFKAWVDELHHSDLARSPEVAITSGQTRGTSAHFAPENMIDDRFETYFATDEGVTSATIEIQLGAAKEISGFILQEYIPLGQRVDGYAIDCMVNGQWQEVAKGRRIGYKRIHLEGRGVDAKNDFPKSAAIRLRIVNAEACPLISTFKVIGESTKR